MVDFGSECVKKLDIYYVLLSRCDLHVARHHDLVVPLQTLEVTYLSFG
jgi:hypothetical protein